MAFEQPNFAPIGANSSQSPRTFSYITDVDNLSQVSGIGYFTDKQFQLNDGDFIYVIATDGQNIFRYQNVGAPMLEIVTTAASDQFPTIVSVTSASDFPDAITGVRTLAASTMYLVGAAVDIGSDSLVYSSGTQIQGINSTISSITSTTASPLLTCLDKTFRVSKITLTNPNGPLFNFRGSPSFPVLIENVVAFSYGSLGTLDDVNAAFISLCGFTAAAPGFLFTGSGSISAVLITNSLFSNYTTTAIDLGTVVLNGFQSIDNNFNSGGGTTAISGLTNSGNVTVRGLVVGNVFDGAGDAISGLATSDLKYIFRNNVGLPSSITTAFVFVADNSTETAIATSDTPVKVNVGTSAVTNTDSRFTVSNTGTMTYIGLEPVCLKVTYGLFADNASGNNKRFAFYVAVNGTVIEASRAVADFDSANPQNVGMVQAKADLVTGDTVDLFTANITSPADTTNITIIDFSGIAD